MSADDSLSNADVYALLSKKRPTAGADPAAQVAEPTPGVEQDQQEPLGREAAALIPWSDDEKLAFAQHCIAFYGRDPRVQPFSVPEHAAVDWLRQHRGLPPIVRPATEPMRWVMGAYGGRKSIRDLEEDARPAHDGFNRPGGGNLGGKGA